MERPQDLFALYLASVNTLSTEKLDFYEFEKQFVSLHDEFGRQMLQHRLAEEAEAVQPVYKKKIDARYGTLRIDSTHPYSQPGNGFKISPYLQELILATCAESPYSISKDLLSKYLNLEINEMQLYRLTDHYGEELGEVLENNTSLHPLEKQEDVLYAMVDGSMILTRLEQYKEVKLGRLFRGQDCLQLGDKQGKITQSQYISHLGDSKVFTARMEKVLEAYGSLKKRLIFITDGAVWMRKWIGDAYPEAISILDFYHAIEYLCAVAKDYFEAEVIQKNWTLEMETHLLNSCTAQVIAAVKSLQQEKEMPSAGKLINYYTENISRMDYAYYRTIGKGLIGSGAMESAHRTVIQCRMKRSGQRWSNKGAANMLALRTIKMNGQWDIVCQTISKQYHHNRAA